MQNPKWHHIYVQELIVPDCFNTLCSQGMSGLLVTSKKIKKNNGSQSPQLVRTYCALHKPHLRGEHPLQL